MAGEAADVVADFHAAQWEDVTQAFHDATDALTLGQIVHVPEFNQFESMSALELMDPKMDSGMLAPGQVMLTVEERLTKGLIPLHFASAADLLATLDRLEQCEAAWRNGQPMAQSLLTCLYYHPCVSSELLLAPLDTTAVSVTDTLDCIFKAYLAMALKSITVQRYAIHRADIYEEEDFSPLNSDLALGDAITDDTVIYWLDLAEKRLDALLYKGKGKKKSMAVEGLHVDPSVALDFATLFQSRLHFRRSFYIALTTLGTAESPDLEAAATALDEAHTVLQRMATERLEVAEECFHGSYVGFDNHVSRLLASTMPPREAKLECAADSYAQTTKVCRHLMLACTPPATIQSMDDLKAFLTHLSSLRPNILVRSYAVLFLYIDKKMYGKYNFMDWLADSMVMNGVPSVLLSTQEGIGFSTRCIEAVYESLKCHLHNRPRQRHRLELLFDEWAQLQVDAASIDDKFVTEMGIPKASYPRYFTSWALEQTSALMIHYLTLGFELDIYALSEYSTIYWYLDYLLGSRIQNLTNAWSFVEKLKSFTTSERAKTTPLPAPAAPPKSKKKGTKKSKSTVSNGTLTAAAATPEDERAVYLKEKYAWNLALLESHRGLTRALFQYVIGLGLDGLLPPDATVYGSPSIRFHHRFKPFARLQFPAPLSYADLVHNCDFSQYKVRSSPGCGTFVTL
ncbi:hypothetical protein, variant [Aphanomyces invadans]|uniref:Uncharacterized protein n=1 Tax=Aphanomyces invadans TaxID=157072 RepID=A0A024T9B3_9STRA|nr:hypothetical protein, variant [Aphanomyces invadans]ETV90589.1 hypothetical protein, variant [Aphanomyces invadans]|eukprot:XP_008880775.1 hypothetical protein, variant [Aphanomyces invadans]